MRDWLPREYDEWRTRNAEDQADIDNARREREEYLADRADYLHDREKDERAEREAHNRDCDRDYDRGMGDE